MIISVIKGETFNTTLTVNNKLWNSLSSSSSAEGWNSTKHTTELQRNRTSATIQQKHEGLN